MGTMWSRLASSEVVARVASALALPGVPAAFGRRCRILALAYHRIGAGDRSELDRGLFSATEEDFDRQVRFLTRHFDVIVPDQLDDARRDRGHFALITFDDGYRDNYTTAFPILRANGARATFFLTTGFIGSDRPAWWDEIAWMIRHSPLPALPASRECGPGLVYDRPSCERAIRSVLRRYKALDSNWAPQFVAALGEITRSGSAPAELSRDIWMSWAMVREMHETGMQVGGHTVTHPVLARADALHQQREILGCGETIGQKVGRRMSAFSYPVGGRSAFNEVTVRCLSEAGVRFAFSYYGGAVRLAPWNPFDVQRIAIERDYSLHRFRALTVAPDLFG